VENATPRRYKNELSLQRNRATLRVIQKCSVGSYDKWEWVNMF